MSDALIGYTGFVGSTLARLRTFSDVYNSTNIDSIAGKEFKEIVCAGVPAVKWIANKEPERDLASIAKLLSALRQCKAERFTLISTIDVYPDPSGGADENADLASLNNHAYGRHRLMVEEAVTEHFANVVIARLPALFGKGLKKNIVFDFLTGNETRKINPASSFQWYPLSRLGNDLDTAWKAGIRLVNLFPEPIPTAWIASSLFPGVDVAFPAEPAQKYNLRTRYAEVFGGPDGFLASSASIKSELKQFVQVARMNPERELLL